MSAGTAASARRRRALAAQVNVSAALVLAALLLEDAASRLGTIDRTGLELLALAAAAIALVVAALPWVVRGSPPALQRAGIWSSLILATVPAATAVTAIGFAAVGGWQLLLVAGVLAELGARRRILLVVWALTAVTAAVVQLHVLEPVV